MKIKSCFYIAAIALLVSCMRSPQNTTSLGVADHQSWGDPESIGVLERKRAEPAVALPPAAATGLPSESVSRFVIDRQINPRSRQLPHMSRDEELWIVTRNPGGPFASEDYPTGGCLRSRVRGREVPLPLKH